MADRVRHGLHKQLEELATEMILTSLEGVTSRDEKSDVMTPWKEKHRKTHEIQTRSGAPVDPAIRRGIFGRAYNPVQTHLNSYDGPTRPIRMSATWDDDEDATNYGYGAFSAEFASVVGVERED